MQLALQEDLKQEVVMLWRKDKDLNMFSTDDFIVLQGSFSYGAHGGGRYYVDEANLAPLEKNNQIVFQYCSENDEMTQNSIQMVLLMILLAFATKAAMFMA